MRTFVWSFAILLVLLSLAPDAQAVGTVPARLESVSILAAGTGSSVAVRTSAAAALVATTAADARTVVIELVGIAAEHRDMAVNDAAGMVARIAIETVNAASGSVTRIRVSLARAYRHRVRISGTLVYVDFERADESQLARAPERVPANSPVRPSTSSASGTTAAKPSSQTPPPSHAPVRVADNPKGAQKTAAAPVVDRAPASSPTAGQPGSATSQVSLLARWLAITEPLQHTVSPPSEATAPGRAWMPLILSDGSTVFSYGDYTEVGDQVAFLLPFDDSDSPNVEAVSLPRSALDLKATAQAAESVRAARYMLTGGPREFAALSQDVSNALNAVPAQQDPLSRVKLVEDVRRRLSEWPAGHYGYRAADVTEAVSMLDPILIQLRAAAGVNRIDLSLVAPAAAQAPAMKFRQPTLVDLIENAMRVVSLLKSPAERTAVLRTTASAMERHRADLPAVWLSTGRRRVDTALKSESRIDEAYRKLSADIITDAVRAAGAGNARAFAKLRSQLMERDEQLGQKRQDVIASTLEALRTQSELASRVQQQRNQQTAGLDAIRTYAAAVGPALKRFAEVKGDLQHADSIPPSSTQMQSLRDAMEFVKRTLASCPPPQQVAEAHGLLLTASHLAGVAVQQAVDPHLSREMAGSLRASAATEALIMFERGRQAIDAVLHAR